MNKFYSWGIFILLSLMAANLSAVDTKGLIIKEIKGNEGRRWAVCIGINDYWDDKVTDLKKAQNDAKGMAEIFISTGQFDKVYTMTDDLDPKNKDYPSKFNIEARIDYVTTMAQKDDLIVFAFSGHGIADETNKSYLVPADVRLDKPYTTSCALDYIVTKIKEKQIKKSLLFIDACREELQESKSLKTNGFSAPIYSKAEIAAIFYATKAGWFSYEDKQSDYGIFTRFLIEGLKGKADTDKDSIVSFSELEKYVMKMVYDYAVDLNLEQCPYTKIHGEKFGDLALTAIQNSTTIVADKNKPADMVLVKAGTFSMGSDTMLYDEKPVHTVTLTRDFLMGKYEVTFAEFDAFCAATDFEKPDDEGWGRGSRPVINITWEDAVTYCNWRSFQEGLQPCYFGQGEEISCDFRKNGYRLPTEAEWEYAARGGSHGENYTYAGGDNPDEVAWYISNSGKKTQLVGKKKPNALGLFDMSGNAEEFCWDWYIEGYYKNFSPSVTDPLGPDIRVGIEHGRGDRVMRGGSWFDKAEATRTTRRYWGGQRGSNSNYGFRLVRSYGSAE